LSQALFELRLLRELLVKRRDLRGQAVGQRAEPVEL
jgi:hypothetical protein